LEAGADRFLTKPLDIDELLGLLDEVIAGRTPTAKTTESTPH
jgi:DNA-binding response OmpR family regulator